jgi:ABC-type bacteriocin/lantibiotic exporter with double-glycine peptidase domain
MDIRLRRTMSLIQKLNYLLSLNQKRQLIILAVLLLIGILFEMVGLGVLIPAFGFMLKSDIGKEYPVLQPYLDSLGNPTQLQLVMFGMSILVLVYLVKAIFLVFLSWRQSKFSAELSADLSSKLFLGYMRQPYSFHLQRNSAELFRNIQGEVGQFSFISQSVLTLAVEFSIVLGVALMLIIVEPVGALVVTSFLAVSAIAFHRLTKNKLLNWGERRQLHSGLANQHILQGLGGVKDVKLLGRESYFLDEFNVHNNTNAKIQTRVAAIGLVPRSYLELLAVIGLAGLIVLMMLQKKPLDLLLPTMGVFAAAAFRMIPSANRIMNSMQGIRYAQPVVKLLYEEFSLINNKKTDVIQSKFAFGTELKLEKVTFQYFNTSFKALDNITLNIKKGDFVGFIGLSGSGKSTLVDVILGLLIPQDGFVKVDGQDIQNNMRGWQDQIGYVPQSIYLTDDTLIANVAFGIPLAEINIETVDKVINAAQLDKFVKSLPKGLETFVGERGVRLSGGQRQRIGIARALYHDPAILLFDEATSALDSLTETGVMDAILALKREKTILIVAHRLSTVENCDKLYRLDSGKIVDEGIPETVLKQHY